MGWNVLNEEDSLGDLTRTHVVNSPLAEVGGLMADVAGTNPSTGAYRYYVTDHLGSTRGLYDGTKSALGSYEYSPYGELYASSGSVALDGLVSAFTGKPWDSAAQMYYFPYRWYSPSAARWLTRDPLGMVDGPNVYGYVRGNPVTGLDPLGLIAVNWGSFLRFAGRWLGWAGLAALLIEVGYLLYTCLNCAVEAIDSQKKIINHPKWDPCDPTLKKALDAADFISECSGACAGLPKKALKVIKKFVMRGIS